MKEDFLKINEVNYPHINYGFFTRVDSFSKNNYSSVNCNLLNRFSVILNIFFSLFSAEIVWFK